VTLTGKWHNVKLQFQGSAITGFIENKQVCSITNTANTKGMVGLITGDPSSTPNTALFDNLIINTVNGTKLQPTVFAQDENPPYGTTVSVVAKPQQTLNNKPNFSIRTIAGGSIEAPTVAPGKKVEYSVYTLNGMLLEKKNIDSGMKIKLNGNYSKSEKVLVVKFKTIVHP
jgi:hypothetical protein